MPATSLIRIPWQPAEYRHNKQGVFITAAKTYTLVTVPRHKGIVTLSCQAAPKNKKLSAVYDVKDKTVVFEHKSHDNRIPLVTIAVFENNLCYHNERGQAQREKVREANSICVSSVRPVPAGRPITTE